VVRNFGEFKRKMCYNSAFIIDISKIFASNMQGVFGVGQSNCIIRISLQPTLVGTVTKFG